MIEGESGRRLDCAFVLDPPDAACIVVRLRYGEVRGSHDRRSCHYCE